MTQNNSIGADQPEDRADLDRNGVADRSERDFKEAGQTTPQPSSNTPAVKPRAEDVEPPQTQR